MTAVEQLLEKAGQTLWQPRHSSVGQMLGRLLRCTYATQLVRSFLAIMEEVSTLLCLTG